MKGKKFLRRNWDKYKRLGLRNKKKQVWRKPKGIHAKMRKRRRGYPDVVKIGYRTEKNKRGRINGAIPVIVRNLNGLEKISKESIVIIGKVGDKKKALILKAIQEKGIPLMKNNKNE